ncbi:MAG: T9SS type A sorting domain-containing protein, partial [Saprospiraceae bacterium]
IGIGTQGGPNIPVRAGMTHVTFNSATGAYYFSVASDIGIIGAASPYGWDADVNMYQDTADANHYTLSLGLVAGDAKFRQDDAWDINWGATDFPSGVGVQNGPNIPVNPGGTYNIDFNKSTGAYSFTLTSFSTIGIIGSATPGGSTPTPLMSTTTPGGWTLTTILLDGGLQFEGDGVATWGGTDFPSGTAKLDGAEIPVTAGRYIINFNSKTLAYEFIPLEYYSVMGIIGSATPGGWDTDTDMALNPNFADSSEWALRVILTDGELKFRANHDWAANWGSGDFPIGTGLRDGANIPVTAGEYQIYFNSFTGGYGFFEIRVYSAVGMVGTATPNASWDLDVQMEKDANNENLWKLASGDFTTGEAKFRAEGAWATNWGSADFPSGTGTQDGPNILVVAGTYGVTLNSSSGEYAFGDPLSATHDLLNPSSITVFPNPAAEKVNIDLSATQISGEVNLKVFDMSGRLVLSEVQQGSTQMSLNVASLQNGHYTLQISNSKYIIGKTFAIAK